MLSMSKKKKAAPVPKRPKELGLDSSGSDSDWASNAKNKPRKKKTGIKRSPVTGGTHSRSDSASGSDDKSEVVSFSASTAIIETPVKTATASDLEEGEVSSSESDDESSGEEFDDGYDENLMGDEEDKRRLSEMTEKEREQEIYKRVENRENKKARYEIEKKLRKKKRRGERK